MPSSALSVSSASSSGSITSEANTTNAPRTIPVPSTTLKPPKDRSQTITQQRQSDSTRRPSVADRNVSSGVLRKQLHNLFPHHALFHVRLRIHQLSSVPLVHGEFGVKWKFKNVHSMSKPGLLRRGRPSRAGGHEQQDDGDANGDDEDDGDYEDGEGEVNSAEISFEDSSSFSVPSVVVSGHDTKSLATSSSGSTHTSAVSNPYAEYLLSDLLHTSTSQPAMPSVPSNPPSSTSLSASTPVESYAPARGLTPYLKLKEHSVTWEQTVDVVVQMAIERDSRNLLPSDLKLVVVQRVVPGDPDAPSNPRLGAIYLNLAEYADAGSVTRRYLLRESKTNATLKLTIELEHVGGEDMYHAPPLPKGEILGGIAGLLENDVYRTRPRDLELYYDGADKPYRTAMDEPTARGKSDVPFDVTQLPSAIGPRTTESLIEAIFNPVPTTSPKSSPFTYFVSAAEVRADSARSQIPVRDDIGAAAHDPERASVYSASSEYTSASVRSGAASGGHGDFGEDNGDISRSWWRKRPARSRPGTPAK